MFGWAQSVEESPHRTDRENFEFSAKFKYFGSHVKFFPVTFSSAQLQQKQLQYSLRKPLGTSPGGNTRQPQEMVGKFSQGPFLPMKTHFEGLI